MLRTPEHVALKLVDAYGDMDVREELAGLDVPTLVIGARGDESTPVDRSVELSQLIPGASLVTVDGAGHFVQLERPDEVNEALMAFPSWARAFAGSDARLGVAKVRTG
jgi:pimeloyl-ACP methyl ester carboxylesterase